MRAVVIIPRSPTITMFSSAKVSFTAVTAAVNAVGSAVFPANTRTATGHPAGSVSSRVFDLREVLLAVPGVAAFGQRAFRAGHPGRGQVEQRHPRRVHLRVQMPWPPTSSRCRPGGPAGSPSRRTPRRWTHRATARSAPRVTSSQAVMVASFDAGATAREMINANARSRIRAGRAQQRGQAQCAARSPTPRRRARAAPTG